MRRSIWSMHLNGFATNPSHWIIFYFVKEVHLLSTWKFVSRSPKTVLAHPWYKHTQIPSLSWPPSSWSISPLKPLQTSFLFLMQACLHVPSHFPLEFQWTLSVIFVLSIAQISPSPLGVVPIYFSPMTCATALALFNLEGPIHLLSWLKWSQIWRTYPSPQAPFVVASKNLGWRLLSSKKSLTSRQNIGGEGWNLLPSTETRLLKTERG